MRKLIAASLLALIALSPAFAQKKKSKATEPAATKPAESAASQTASTATPTAAKDDEEDKGPWKALTYRLVGP